METRRTVANSLERIAYFAAVEQAAKEIQESIDLSLSSTRLGCYRRHCHDWEAAQAELLQAIEPTWKAPAEATLPALNHLGFATCRAHLSRLRWAEVDFLVREVRVAVDLERRLDYPQVVREVYHSSLAHELGHVVLHQGKRPQRSHEDEAWVWATLWLVPWRMIGRRPEVRALDGDMLSEKQRWAKIFSLARDFQVSGKMMRFALAMYGIGQSACHGRAASYTEERCA